MADRSLNATAASLLGFLHYGSLTGWDLVATAEMVIGDFWSITQSQVYRELAAMAADGLIEAGERGARDRQPYTITAGGRAAFAQWVNRQPGEEVIRFPLLLTMAFGRHLEPERLAAFLAHHRALHEARLSTYTEQQAGAESAGGDPDPFRMATLDFGLTYERAVLDWFDRLPSNVTAPSASRGRRGRRPTG